MKKYKGRFYSRTKPTHDRVTIVTMSRARQSQTLSEKFDSLRYFYFVSADDRLQLSSGLGVFSSQFGATVNDQGKDDVLLYISFRIVHSPFLNRNLSHKFE